MKIDNAIAIALSGSGTLDADIVKNLIDKSIVKLGDDGKLIGFGEQFEKIKTDKSFLFGNTNAAKEEPASQMSTGMKAIAGAQPTSDTAKTTFSDALAEHYNV